MPGSSLWLLPPPSHPLNKALTSLIQKTSEHFNSPHRFLPHITLTSEIKPEAYGDNPQQWLDNLDFPAGNDVEVRLEGVASEDVFFRKLYIAVDKGKGVRQLAKVGREVVEGLDGDRGKVERWVAGSYKPHLSLLYHDIPKVGETQLEVVGEWVRDVSVGMEKGEEGGFWGWRGGRVVLVPTDKEIVEWIPVAGRDL